MSRPAYPRGITRSPIVDPPSGMRVTERSTRVPAEAVAQVGALVRSWEFKRQAGFVVPSGAPTADGEGLLAKRLLGIRFSEPVRVVWADASGFGYETRPGHPLYGEESFQLSADGIFTARSISRPASSLWWLLSPALRLLQRTTHDRYVRIIDEAASTAMSRRAASTGPYSGDAQ